MQRALDPRLGGPPRHRAGAPSSRILVVAGLLQVMATLLALHVWPASAGSARTALPATSVMLPGTAPAAGPPTPVESPASGFEGPSVEGPSVEGPSVEGPSLEGPSAPPTAALVGRPTRSASPAAVQLDQVLAAPSAGWSAAGLSSSPQPTTTSGSAPTAPSRSALDRTSAVQALLALRGRALLARDETAFLSVLDPAAAALRTRQEALFAALEQVPLASWEYALDASVQQPADPQLDRRYGVGRWWAPRVVLWSALAGVDDRASATVQHLTFVERDGRWLLAADDDFAAAGLTTRRALWDAGPVVAERVDGVLVLGRPADRVLLREVAALTAAAVPRVSAAWGADWRQAVVVLVPGSERELAELLDSDQDLSRIAGLAIAELGDPARGQGPTGERILLNRDVFSALNAQGQRLVLTHELTHVATRRATGPAVPTWLAEGYADHVGYSGMSLPLSVTAGALQADVRAGRLPDRLPVDADFDGASPALAQAYEQSWLAVRLLSEQYGQDGLLRFYRAVGRDRGADPAAAVERALRAELGSTTAQLVADWRAALQRDLG